MRETILNTLIPLILSLLGILISVVGLGQVIDSFYGNKTLIFLGLWICNILILRYAGIVLRWHTVILNLIVFALLFFVIWPLLFLFIFLR